MDILANASNIKAFPRLKKREKNKTDSVGKRTLEIDMEIEKVIFLKFGHSKKQIKK